MAKMKIRYGRGHQFSAFLWAEALSRKGHEVSVEEVEEDVFLVKVGKLVFDLTDDGEFRRFCARYCFAGR